MNDQLLRARNATIGELERFLWVISGHREPFNRMSALAPKADISPTRFHVCLVPTAEVKKAAN